MENRRGYVDEKTPSSNRCILGPKCDCEYNRGNCVRTIGRETQEKFEGMACLTVCWAYKQRTK